MKRTAIKLFSFFLLALMGFSTLSCKKELSGVGNELQPPGDLLEVKFLNSNAINAFSTLDNPRATSGISSVALGMLNDEVFGPTKTGLSINFYQTSENIRFQENPILDSLVLSLEYLKLSSDKDAGYYGDTTSKISYKIYRLNQKLNTNQLSDEEPDLSTATVLVDNFSFSPIPSDSVRVKDLVKEINVNRAPQIRITLPNELGEEIFAYANATDGDNKPKDNDDAAFKEFLKGIYIQTTGVESGIGVLPIFNIGNSNAYSRLEIFYTREDANGDRIADSYAFTTAQNSGRTAYYNHQPDQSTDANFKAQVIDGDTDAGNQQLYVQGLSGVESIIKFPEIVKWADEVKGKNTKIAINKAELIIPVKDGSISNNYKEVNLLGLKINLPNDIFQVLPGYNSENFGGQYIEDEKAYRFLVTRYVQGVIDGKASNILGVTYPWDEIGIRLYNANGVNKPGRVILNGADFSSIDDNLNMRLEMTYTVIND